MDYTLRTAPILPVVVTHDRFVAVAGSWIPLGGPNGSEDHRKKNALTLQGQGQVALNGDHHLYTTPNLGLLRQ